MKKLVVTISESGVTKIYSETWDGETHTASDKVADFTLAKAPNALELEVKLQSFGLK